MLDQDKNFFLDKFEYSHYLFARKCMDIVGRSCMSITSESYRVKETELDNYASEMKLMSTRSVILK